MEFERWPKFKEQWIRTFEKLIELRKSQGLSLRNASTTETWFEWWMSDGAQDEPVDENQLMMDELAA